MLNKNENTNSKAEENIEAVVMKEEELEKEESENENRTTDYTEPKIRVVLMTDQFKNYFHEKVQWEVNGSIQEIYADTMQEKQKILKNGMDGIKILSLKRNNQNPIYYGNLEVYKEDQGLLLINELPLELYLKSVVPSEMPSEYEREALKAQAICARTYACKQIEENKMKRYYAHVDDSVNCQVYNNIPMVKTSSDAVEETRGKVMYFEDQLIQAYYFSTSSGMTNTDEIWGADISAPYLKSVSCNFDAFEPWCLWQTVLSWDILNQRFMEKTKIKENILGFEINQKSQSGAIYEMIIRTDSGKHTLQGEYEIREFLRPSEKVILNNGQEVSDMSILPSACFVLKAIDEEYIMVEGKGYGHGVGMSQNGANSMAMQGYSCEEILEYFFKDIKIATYQ